jgi:phage terminase large subunit-like protein
MRKEAMVRTEDDPLRTWEPHAKQKPFIKEVLVDGTREVWYTGGNRTGKSDAGAYIGGTLARFGREDPRTLPHAGAKIQMKDRSTSGWVVGLDWPTLRSTIQPKYFDNGITSPGEHPPFIPEREIKEWAKSEQILKLKNGSIIEFKSADSEASKFQGAAKDWIHFDEVPPKAVYEESIIRVGGGRRLQIFGTATLLPPSGVRGGVSWLFLEKIKPWQRGETENFEVFQAAIYDNPYIDPEEIRYLEAQFPPGSPMRAIRLDGELIPGVGGALVYSKFNRDIHVADQEYDPSRPLCWIWDFNVAPMITLVGQRNGSEFRFIDEFVFHDGGNIPDMCEAFYHDYAIHRAPVWIYGDATGSGRGTQTGKSDYDVIWSSMRRFDMTIRMKVPTINPPVALRVNSMNRQLEDELGVVNVRVDPRCKEFIEDLEDVRFDPRGGIKKSHDNRDPYYARTHASDAAGYWVAYEAPIVRDDFKSHEHRTPIRQIGYGFAHN